MIGRRDYETRKAARIERLQNRAERLRSEGTARLEGARRIGDMIPLGQPILVGHHSEKRHRRDIARIDASYRKGFAALKQAESCERRALVAEENHAISSDDPEALTKLRARLDGMKIRAEQMKQINTAFKRGGWTSVTALFPTFDTAAAQRTMTLCGHDRPFPGFKFTNLSGNRRRVEARIESLEKRDAAPEVPPETIGEVRIVEEDNRVLVFFPGKPAEEIRTALKSNGFRWAPSVGAWSRMASNGAHYYARENARKVAASAA